MATKKINLKGISRTPSDRGVGDGSLAESLNMQLESGELVPASLPVELTADAQCWQKYGIPPSSEGLNYDVLYLHKTTSLQKYICKYGGQLGYWTMGQSTSVTLTGPTANIVQRSTTLAQCISYTLTEYGLPAIEDLQTKLNNFAQTNQLDLGVLSSPSAAQSFMASIQRRLDRASKRTHNSFTILFSTSQSGLNNYSFVSFGIVPETGESFDDCNIKSVGNTLVIASNKHLHYVLYLGGAYKYLGTKVPKPEINFFTITDVSTQRVQTKNFGKNWPRAAFDHIPMTQEEWRLAAAGGVTQTERNAGYNRIAFINENVDACWNIINDLRSACYAENKFPCGTILRVALKLYDGSYVYPSTPNLCLGNKESYRIGILCHDPGGTEAKFFSAVVGRLLGASTVKYYIDQQNAISEDWSDIIQSVDIFASDEISNCVPNSLSDRIGDSSERFAEYLGTDPSGWPSVSGNYYFEKIYCKEQKNSDDENIINSIKKTTGFYLLKSFNLEEYNNIPASGNAETLKPKKVDDLMTQTALKEDAKSNYPQSAINGLGVYNERLMLKGVRYESPELPTSFMWIDTTGIIASESNHDKYKVSFRVKTSFGKNLRIIEEMGQSTQNDIARQFLAFPDSRCDRAYIRRETSAGVVSSNMLEIDMSIHDLMDWSYFYGNQAAWSTLWASGATMPKGATLATLDENLFVADDILELPNQISQSEVSNPFFFPLAGKRTFSGDVLDVATITKPISIGQFGEFDNYIFTSEGIWTVSISSDGSISSAKPLSQDVAFNGTVSQIDQAIVFNTKAGLKILTSGEIKNISKTMEGKPFSPDTALVTMLNGDASWKKYLGSIINDTDSFQKFMEDATAVYDYTGGRLLFINPSKAYQYIYVIGNDTWCKISQIFHNLVGSNDQYYGFPVRSVNAYPEALIQMSIKTAPNQTALNGTRLFSFGEERKVTDVVNKQRGIIITRPLAFDAVDIRKSINALRVRGQYAFGDVKYILQGSMNGNDWVVLNSLRGGSWKWFRVVILPNILAGDAVSWIEAEVENRLADRLR